MTPGTPMVLAPMRWWDIPEVHELERALFPVDPWTVPQFWSELAGVPQTRSYLVAREPGAAPILGYAGLFQAGDEAQVQTIGVAPAARGRGLGRELLRALLTAAAARRAATVALEVRADNHAALALYQQAGFTPDGRRRDYYGRGSDAVLMSLRLDGAGHG